MSFEDMDEEEERLYLDALLEGTTPFDRFVSRGKLEDVVDVPGPRRRLDPVLFRLVNQTQSDGSTRMIPVLGSAGSGKTHAYWAYKSFEKRIFDKSGSAESKGNLPRYVPENWRIVYVPSPPSAVRILLHIYTCLLDELSSEILSTLADKLIERWNPNKKKKMGLFGGHDLETTIQNGIREYPGVFADCVKALCLYKLGGGKKSGLAERWLLGEDLDEDELDELNINSVIEEDDICLAMLKLILENIDFAVILYFDELESPYRMHGPDAEAAFLETLKKVYNEINNIVIVLAVLKEIWPRILETADQATKSRMEQEAELQFFSFDDLLIYFAKAMAFFWESNNLNSPSYPLFPLNEKVLKLLYEKTDGNQRSIIKLIRIFVDKLLYEDLSLDELYKEEKESKKVPIGVTINDDQLDKDQKAAVQEILTPAPKSENGDQNLIDRIDQMMSDEDYTIEANPQSVVGAAIKSIRVLAELNSKDVKISFNFKFKIDNRDKTLAGLIQYDNAKCGIEIPPIKDFNRSGGVGAFYAVKRIQSAINQENIDKAILIVPENTKGAKYQSICKLLGEKLQILEFNEESAKWLIKASMTNPSAEGKVAAEYIIGNLDSYTPPIAPYEQEETEEGETSESSNDSQPNSDGNSGGE